MLLFFLGLLQLYQPPLEDFFFFFFFKFEVIHSFYKSIFLGMQNLGSQPEYLHEYLLNLT